MVATDSTELAANRMLGRSSGNHDWLLANASDCVWMETGLEVDAYTQHGRVCLCVNVCVCLRECGQWPCPHNVVSVAP